MTCTDLEVLAEFDKFMCLCNSNPYQDVEPYLRPRKFLHTPSQSFSYLSLLVVTTELIFFYYRLVPTVPEFHINGIVKYALLILFTQQKCSWDSSMLLCVCCFVAASSLLLFIAD